MDNKLSGHEATGGNKLIRRIKDIFISMAAAVYYPTESTDNEAAPAIIRKQTTTPPDRAEITITTKSQREKEPNKFESVLAFMWNDTKETLKSPQEVVRLIAKDIRHLITSEVTNSTAESNMPKDSLARPQTPGDDANKQSRTTTP